MSEDQARSKPQRAGKNGNVPPAEHRWKKGVSGNPGGRPKGSGVTGALRTLLEQIHNGKPLKEVLAERWLKDALSGKPAHLQMLLDRTEGKVRDEHDVNISGVRPRDEALRLTDEEKVVYAIELNRLDLLSPRLQEEARKRMAEEGGDRGT
jgi:hypothetical protein